MATKTHIRTGAAAALVLAATFLAVQTRPAPAQSGSACGGSRTLLTAEAPSALSVTQTLAHAAVSPAAYDWPVKPFDRQHPVRSFLDDPRIASKSQAFHFGIDVSAPDGTPVYAVEAGEVFFDSGRSIAVVSGPSHEFGYWHIVPSVKSHQHVKRHQLLGVIDKGWEHVHFAERLNGVYINPLRPGGLGPYTDTTAPSIAEVSLVQKATGTLTVLANAYDTPSPRVPGDWANEPVTPALLRWRVLRDGRPVGGWRTAADFRNRMIDADRFHSIYAPATVQNHKGEAGLLCFYLSESWKPADGVYRIEVQAFDTRENRADARLDFTVENGSVQS
jgi:murein DD-endopeptidase MepM/ murein hydrolase activator NlpD